MVYKWLSKARSVVFPAHCRLCLAACPDGLEVCPACRLELPWLTRCCHRCARPLAGEDGLDLCTACLATPPLLDACHALFSYRPPIDQWIQALKFGRDLAIGRMLGQLLADRVTPSSAGKAPTLLPVPLHPRRLRQRGYNQALELARPLLGNGWSLSGRTCRRKRYTTAQTGLPAQQRRRNLSGAFSVSRRLYDQHVLIIDDVMTTGTTLNEMAYALKAAGAERVEAWVIARALKHGEAG